MSQVSFANDSWTAPLDAMRLIPGQEATTATVGQVTRLLALLPKDRDVPLFVFDAGYDPIALGHELNGERVEVLVGSATTGSSTAIRRRGRTGRRHRADVLHATGRGPSARTKRVGPPLTTPPPCTMSATAR